MSQLFQYCKSDYLHVEEIYTSYCKLKTEKYSHAYGKNLKILAC